MEEETKNTDIVGISAERIKQIVLEKIPTFLEQELNNNYGNPIKKAIEKSIEEQDGAIKKLVGECLTEILSNAEFKNQISLALIQKIVTKGLN